jgi:hypothetical protein
MGTPADKPGPNQHSPLDRLIPNQGKKRIINKQLKKKKTQRTKKAGCVEVWRVGEKYSLLEL